MSDFESHDFDDQLRRLADAASFSARPMAPEEIRRRGNVRRTRRTVAVTAAVALAIGGLGATAIMGAQPGRDGFQVASPGDRGTGGSGVSPLGQPTPVSSRISTPGAVSETPVAGPSRIPATRPPSPSFDGGTAFAAPPAGTPAMTPEPDPLGPGSVARTAAPTPGDSSEEVAARAAMLATSELPSVGFGSWTGASRTFPVNCAPYTIPGHADVKREDRYARDDTGSSAWQEILLPADAAEAQQLYDARVASAAACSPSNVVTQESLTDADASAVYAYTTACKPAVETCGDLAFVVGVARVQNVVVYVQFSGEDDLDLQATTAAMQTVVSRVRASPLVS